MEITKCVVPIFCEQERVRPAASEVNRLVADTAKLRGLTNWQPATSFREGLRRTVDWISCNLAPFNLDQYAR
jgi:nucleoside-diphosphate-sugar epimerase